MSVTMAAAPQRDARRQATGDKPENAVSDETIRTPNRQVRRDKTPERLPVPGESLRQRIARSATEAQAESVSAGRAEVSVFQGNPL